MTNFTYRVRAGDANSYAIQRHWNHWIIVLEGEMIWSRAWSGVVPPGAARSGPQRHTHAMRHWQTAPSSSSEFDMNARVALPLTAAARWGLTCGVLLWKRRDGAEIPAHAGVEAADSAPTGVPLPPAPALTPASVGSESPAAESPELPVQLTLRSLPATHSY